MSEQNERNPMLDYPSIGLSNLLTRESSKEELKAALQKALWDSWERQANSVLDNMKDFVLAHRALKLKHKILDKPTRKRRRHG